MIKETSKNNTQHQFKYHIMIIMAFSHKSSVLGSLLPPGGYKKIPLLTPDQTDATISALILIPALTGTMETLPQTHIS